MRIPGKRPPSSSSSLANALRFAALGFTVLPVKPRSKHLFAGRTPSSPPTPADLTARWEQLEKDVPLNVGIKTGARHRLIVVDIDSPAGLAVAELAFPEPVCRTERGVPGKQRWLYAPPDDAPVPTVRKWRGHDIDILGDGAYFVAPGSVLDDGDVIEEIGPNGGPWTAEALARLPRFDRSWLETNNAADVVLMARFRGGLPDQWRLLEASARVFARVKHSGEKMSFCCPFHDDRHPSAVLFKEGWFHCAACGVSEPAQLWTKRPEVAHLHFDRLIIPIAATKPTLDETQFRVPRLLIEVSALMHGDLAGSHARNLVQRGDGHVDGPDHLSEGELAVLWAIVASAKAVEDYAGGVVLSRGGLADALGWSSPSTRAGVDKAVKKLGKVRVRMRPFAKEAPSVGPLVEERPGWLFIHPALVAMLNARGKQWAAVSRAVLRFSHRARMVAADAARRALDDPHPLPLQQLARGCGVWNTERTWRQRSAYLRAWRVELADDNPAAHLEWRDGEWVVVVGPGRCSPLVLVGGGVSPSGGGDGLCIHATGGGDATVRVEATVSPSGRDEPACTALDDVRISPSLGDASSSARGEVRPQNPRKIGELADRGREQGPPRPDGGPADARALSTPTAPMTQHHTKALVGRQPGKRQHKAAVIAFQNPSATDDHPQPETAPAAPLGGSLRRAYKRPR